MYKKILPFALLFVFSFSLLAFSTPQVMNIDFTKLAEYSTGGSSIVELMPNEVIFKVVRASAGNGYTYLVSGPISFDPSWARIIIEGTWWREDGPENYQEMNLVVFAKEPTVIYGKKDTNYLSAFYAIWPEKHLNFVDVGSSWEGRRVYTIDRAIPKRPARFKLIIDGAIPRGEVSWRFWEKRENGKWEKLYDQVEPVYSHVFDNTPHDKIYLKLGGWTSFREPIESRLHFKDLKITVYSQLDAQNGLLPPPFAGEEETSAEEAIHFALTKGYYRETDNLEEAVKNEFGPDAYVADWNDIKAYIGNNPERLRKFCDEIGLEEDGVALVVRNGIEFWNGPRHYFIQRSFDGLPHPDFLAHDDILNALFLGSWHHIRMRVLAVVSGTLPPPTPTPTPNACGVRPEGIESTILGLLPPPDGHIIPFPKVLHPGGSSYRGACGSGKPDTAVDSEDRAIIVTYPKKSNCYYLVHYKGVVKAGTHLGCRFHDACFDICKEKKGEDYAGSDFIGPCHDVCSGVVVELYGEKQGGKWALGYGPYDDQILFSQSVEVLGPYNKDNTPVSKLKEEGIIPQNTVIYDLPAHPSRSLYMIEVWTGGKLGAGTDANIYITLFDTDGRTSGEMKLPGAPVSRDSLIDAIINNSISLFSGEGFRKSGFERNNHEKYYFLWGGYVKNIDHILLRRDDEGIGPDWYCEKIKVYREKWNSFDTTEKLGEISVKSWIGTKAKKFDADSQ